MKLTIVGSSDAFGSGGRLQTCFHVATDDGNFLIDCGVTSLAGMERAGLDPAGVSHIYISHLHGDHFGGLVWWTIHAQHVSQRTEPLTIAGPPGIEKRFRDACDVLFPGALPASPRFDIKFVELFEGPPVEVGPAKVSVFEVCHPCGAPPYALRIQVGSKTIAFSGDTEWVDTLIDAASDADLFISECYAFDRVVRNHLSWKKLREKLPELTAKRIVLTHMGPHMLQNRSSVEDPRVRLAHDGMTIEL